MDWPLAIETPLGRLAVALSCGLQPACAPDEDWVLESGAVVATWRDLAGVMVDLLLTRYDSSQAVPSGYAVPECWGMEWRFHAPGGWTPPMVLSALLPEGAGASCDADEDVIVAEAWTDDWRLCVGGADDVWFARQVESAGMAPSWGKVFSEVGPPGVGGLGAWQTERGLTWFLPGLEEGESATVWVALAWCPADAREADNAANFAVDVGAAFIRAAAGIGVSRPRGS